MSERKSLGRLKVLPNYTYKILMSKVICKSKPNETMWDDDFIILGKVK